MPVLFWMQYTFPPLPTPTPPKKSRGLFFMKMSMSFCVCGDYGALPRAKITSLAAGPYKSHWRFQWEVPSTQWLSRFCNCLDLCQKLCSVQYSSICGNWAYSIETRGCAVSHSILTQEWGLLSASPQRILKGQSSQVQICSARALVSRVVNPAIIPLSP